MRHRQRGGRSDRSAAGPQEHGDIPSLGFRFGGLAYSCDLSGLPEASIAALAGTEVWIVDALRYRPHPSHFSVDDALPLHARSKPGSAILYTPHSHRSAVD